MDHASLPQSPRGRLPRLVVLCLVAGVHWLAFVLLTGHRDLTGDADAEKYVVWLQLPLPSSRVELSPAVLPLIPKLQREPSATPAPEIPPSPTSITQPRTNWQDAGRFYARKAIEEARTEHYRNLGADKAPPAPAEPQVPPLFEAKQSVFGQIGEDAMGNPIMKLSENCYRELPKRVQTAGDYSGMDAVAKANQSMIKCSFKIGSREARGDLFEHLKDQSPEPSP